jgi:hypothetical protein
LVPSNHILAIGNALECISGYISEYSEVDSILLTIVLIQSRSEIIRIRQASLRLSCLLVNRRKELFLSDVPPPLTIEVASHAPSGYYSQASFFF